MAAYTTIDDPEAYFQVKIWTGTGSSNALTLDGDTDMQPDYVMIKQRSSTQQWNGYDDLRGVQEYLGWNTSIIENTQSQGLTAFGSDGFTVGTDDMVNKSSSTYVAYCWKESATAGFDMVLYTGDGADRTIAHSLSATPDLVIIKRRSDAGNWLVGGASTLGGNNKLLLMDTTAALDDNSEVYQSFSSSTFGIGVNAYVNTDTSTHIAYVFTSIQGFSKFGSYIGNGSATSTFIYTGFKPAFIICKNTADTDHWIVFDNKRNTPPVNNILYPNLSGAEESTAAQSFHFFSNGFRPSGTHSMNNTSGSKYIYMCFAEAPFVNSEGVPCNAR